MTSSANDPAEELSKALGSHAPKAWDRIKVRLEEWRVARNA